MLINNKKNMKTIRFCLLLVLMMLCRISLAQGFSSNFSTENQILQYLASNIANLDPVEGRYDTQVSMRTSSPFQRDFDYTLTYYIVKNPYTNTFQMYIKEEDSNGVDKSPNMRIEPIGETNAYRVYWGNSSNRAYLENGLRLRTNINLSQSDARKYAENSRFAHTIVLGYDFVKSYPTSSMYEAIVRKIAEEQSKPTMWSGTGFALTEGYCVTNYHVVENAKSITIQGVNGSFNNRYSAKVVATDIVNDIALLKLDGVVPNNIPYAIKTFTSDVGEDVWVLGYPLTSTMGDEIKLTTGVVSAKSGFEGDVSLYQISAPIQPGNSGGPLFDSKGNVIGIVCAHHRGAENVNYAIKASYLRNLIESSVNHNILPKTNKISTMNLANKVKAVKNFVYYITCSSTGNGTVSNYNGSSTNINTPSISSTNNYPSINTSAGKLSITSVMADANETVLSFSSTNNLSGGWMNISKDAYILANGIKYKLIGVEDIAYAPEYTYFSYQGQTKSFKLHFQAVPSGTYSIDFIESPSSSWKIYNIKLK